MQGGVEGGANLQHQPGLVVVGHFLQEEENDGDIVENNDPTSTPTIIHNDDANTTSTGGGNAGSIISGDSNDNTQNVSNFYADENIGNRWQQQQPHSDPPAAAFNSNNALIHRKTAGSVGTDAAFIDKNNRIMSSNNNNNNNNNSSELGHYKSSRTHLDNDGHNYNNNNNNNDENNSHSNNNKSIVCYCLPCLSCGHGEHGRSNVRLLSFLLVPIFLLSLFLMDDIYHVLQRNAQLRSALRNGGGDLSAVLDASAQDILSTEVLRRKVVNEFPGIRREMLWIPLERTMTIINPGDGGGDAMSVKAKLACPRGILFLFHGCGRYAASFFYSPQGRKMMSMAIRSGVAVVTIKKNNEKACWDWENDGETVLKLGKKFLLSRVLDACGNADGIVETYPPIWGFGVSSGGAFVSLLSSSMAQDPGAYAPFLFSAINVQIISPPDNVDWNIPTIFTVMDGDEITKARVQARVESKLQSGIGGPFSMITTSGRKGIHPDHFHRLYADDKQMSAEVSRGIYQELVTVGIVDPNNNDMLTGDPRQMAELVTGLNVKYGMEARKSNSENNNQGIEVLPFGVSHQIMRPLQKEEQLDAENLWLTEELNVAWDVHEITAEGFDSVLDFFFEYGVHGIGNLTTTT